MEFTNNLPAYKKNDSKTYSRKFICSIYEKFEISQI